MFGDFCDNTQFLASFLMFILVFFFFVLLSIEDDAFSEKGGML